MIKKYFRHPSNIILRLAEKKLFPMSDEHYIRKRYKEIFNKEIDLDHPKTFNEKLQWLKLHDRKLQYTKMVDKYEAKNYVANNIGEEHIIPTIGIYEKFEDIDFNKLPNQFVIKCTHDSGGLVVCRDKSRLDLMSVKKKINKCLKRNYFWTGREWPYKDVVPKIMIEKYMHDNDQHELVDYKFYCFNGEPKFLYVSEGLEDHSTAKISFFDLDFKMCDFGRIDFKRFTIAPKRPKEFQNMIRIARQLSKGISFLRVDLYEIHGKIYFGELTFTPNAGLMRFDPPEWDEKIGDILVLPSCTKVGKNE